MADGNGEADFKAEFDRIIAPPVRKLLGAEVLEIDPEEGFARVAFTTRDDFLNLAGVVQGGILAAMLDSAMSYSAIARNRLKNRVPTLELKISFIAPAKPGRLIGEGRVIRMGRTIAFLEGKLMDEGGELLATSTATARLVPR